MPPIMTRPRAWISPFVLFIALAIPTGLLAQTPARRHAVRTPTIDAITILQTTDIHDHANGAGHVGLDVDPVTAMSVTGAYARIAAYVANVRTTAGHPVILVDSGDWTMGTLYDLTLGSQPLALGFMSSMLYDAVTLGNHEFDYTPRGLAGMIAAAQNQFLFRTPIVASNMDIHGNADLAPFLATNAIRTTYVKQLSNGVKVGFLGLMGEQAAIEAPASAPVTFTTLSSSYSAIQSMVNDLRNSQGAQIVIALSHSGTDASGNTGEDVELAKHVRGINVIASGHTHTNLDSAHAVRNGTWTTQIIDAGAFGTNVARLDLAVDRTAGVTTPIAFSNVAMTDASLASFRTGMKADAMTAGLVVATDQQLNGSLAPLLSQFFPDYVATSVGKGIYHPVASAAQEMASNSRNAVLSPNGLGDLAADSVRNVPNSIIAQTLAAVGGNPANLPGYDFNPYQLGVVATGVIRATLPAGVPLTFSDVYNVLSLGISPDSTQALPIGYPLVSTYVELADVKKIAALQLVGQSNLIPSDFYLNFSGIRYSLKPAESNTYFKYATAAAILDLTNRKLAGGSSAALQAFSAVAFLGIDHGAGLLSAAAAGNPYAIAMTKLNDANPTAAQMTTNLTVVGDVAGAAIAGTAAVSALVVSKAIAAIDTVSAFAVTDAKNTGSTTGLTGTSRIRGAVDLYALLLIGAVESQYGIKITPFQAAIGTTVLSSADFPTLLGNRIDLSPSTAGVQELKEWMVLLSNIGTGLGGTIGPEYKSTANFTEFSTFGSAVQIRNSTYPLADIAQLVGTVAALQQAP